MSDSRSRRDVVGVTELADIRRSIGRYGQPTAVKLERLCDTVEALRAGRDLAQSIADRYANGWTPFLPEPGESYADGLEACWEHPGTSQVAVEPEPMTAEQAEWFMARRGER